MGLARTTLLIGLALLLPARGLADPDLGQPAPPLVVPELGGGTFDLASLRGRVVVLDFWATWCPPCREEMPALDTLYQRYHPRGLELIAVSVNRLRDRGEVEKAARGLHYPVALLGEAVKDGFGKPGELPVTYVIDRSGVIRSVLRPDAAVLAPDALERAISALLSP